jgi:hypothetical protein
MDTSDMEEQEEIERRQQQKTRTWFYE